MTITTRSGKGSALTHAELDANFTTIGANHNDTAPTLNSGGIGCVAPSEHFVFTQSDGSYYTNWWATPYGFHSGGPSYDRYGQIVGSGMMPDGKSIFVALMAYGNPGGTGIRIMCLGNVSAGNSGWTSVSWQNEAGNVTGSCTRANAGYTSSTHSNTNSYDRYWTISNYQTFTGTNPENIADDGYIKLTFTL